MSKDGEHNLCVHDQVSAEPEKIDSPPTGEEEKDMTLPPVPDGGLRAWLVVLAVSTSIIPVGQDGG